ncbi:flavodoxin family protein [Paractinoplanes rishiriensis]|uniref:Flavodoxin-like domain-containing protein n=1 Tax=Paractinoplanes rishiriensis TaxID=1050105 RepID=A0A919MW93_9ACTN|nr:flavodoxin family protein [Actinoplanes rishiriensis]GIE94430.1 hypothetical protein Ari01nite_18950 [Actinoplanes rishiriensis]
MRALVVYESQFGNTATIARAIADALGATLADVTRMPPLDGVDLLVAGAPTHAFGLSRPTTRQDAVRQGGTRREIGLREFLDAAPLLPGLPAATFATRIDKPFTGSAAQRAHRRLRKLGCHLIAPPEAFRVTGVAGPLLPGETDRARAWALQLKRFVEHEKVARGG